MKAKRIEISELKRALDRVKEKVGVT